MTLLLVVLALTIAIPIVFLLAVLYAAGRRRRGIPIGSRFSAGLTVLGGTCFGIFLVTGADSFVISGPILGGALLLAWSLLRRRRRVQAGQLLLGTALPWTVLYGLEALDAVAHPAAYDEGAVSGWLAIGLVGVILGLALIRRGDPAAPAPVATAPAGDPGSRAYGNIAAAIREPGRIGPFGTSELAALVAFVVVWVFVPLAAGTLGFPVAVGFLAAVVLGALLATEAYIRAMPFRSRRAFEAFSWLGEWELGQASRLGAGGVPTRPADADAWLAAHPETPDNRWIRVEVLLLAARFDEARATAERLPDDTPEEHWQRAHALDDVDWRSGGPGDLASLRAAADGLQPADGDDRLRAEVGIAAAEVRRRMADGRSSPGDALEPLLDVRRRLGRRADGQVGRALRRRLFTTILVISAVIGAALWLLDPVAGQLT